MYIYIYSLLGIPYWLFPVGYSYAYSHLPMRMQWVAPMQPPHVLGPLRPPRPLGRTAPLPPYMGAGMGVAHCMRIGKCE